MSNFIPEDMQELVKELVIYQEEKQQEIEEELLDRLYLEIMPEEPDNTEKKEEVSSNIIIINL